MCQPDVASESIPRILHQTWKSVDVPSHWQHWRESWLALHPGWQYRLWTDEDNRALVASRYPWFLRTYDGFDRPIQRVDAAKYFILHACGGVYADLDTECRRCVDPLVDNALLVLSRTPDGVIDGAFLASTSGHQFWTAVFKAMAAPPWWISWMRWFSMTSSSHVLLSTGPQMLRRTLRAFQRSADPTERSGIRICAPNLLSSRSWLRRFEPFNDEDSYVLHHHDDSWLTVRELFWHRFLNITTLRCLLVTLALGLGGLVWRLLS